MIKDSSSYYAFLKPSLPIGIECQFNPSHLTGMDILEQLKTNVTKQFLNSERALANIRETALESFYNYTGDRWDFDFLERFRNT